MKLFASDYDGTFFRHRNRQPQEISNNLKEIKQWQKAGNLFVFATGRPISMMKLERFRGIKYDYIVGLNGGIIISKTGEIIFQETIHANVAKEVIQLIKAREITNYSVTDGLKGHYEMPFQWNDKMGLLLKVLTFFAPSFRLSLEAALAQSVCQIAVKTKSHEEAIAFAELVNEQFKGEVSAFANLEHVDISAPGLSKATGIAHLVKHHKIKNNDVYCMGDSFNDLPMFEAYCGFTLPEARDEIKIQTEAVYDTVGHALADLSFVKN